MHVLSHGSFQDFVSIFLSCRGSASAVAFSRFHSPLRPSKHESLFARLARSISFTRWVHNSQRLSCSGMFGSLLCAATTNNENNSKWKYGQLCDSVISFVRVCCGWLCGDFLVYWKKFRGEQDNANYVPRGTPVVGSKEKSGRLQWHRKTPEQHRHGPQMDKKIVKNARLGIRASEFCLGANTTDTAAVKKNASHTVILSWKKREKRLNIACACAIRKCYDETKVILRFANPLCIFGRFSSAVVFPGADLVDFLHYAQIAPR